MYVFTSLGHRERIGSSTKWVDGVLLIQICSFSNAHIAKVKDFKA